jgi:hypothetical protein
MTTAQGQDSVPRHFHVAMGRNPLPILIPPNTAFLASIVSCWYIGPFTVDVSEDYLSYHPTNWESTYLSTYSHGAVLYVFPWNVDGY